MRDGNHKQWFRLDDWVVRPGLDRLERGSERVTVEPRVMDVLVCLARRAREVVSPDELVEEVWRGTIVSDAPLYQCLAKLRKALGDDAQHPRYIETVRKRGYRLIAPVEIVAAAPATVPSSPASPRSQSRVAGLLSLLLSVPFLVLSSSDVSVPRVRAGPVTGQFGSIAVLPFADMSEDGSQQYLGDGIAEEVIHRLGRLADVRIVARTSSFAFRDPAADVRAIGEKLGTEALLEGSVRRVGNRIRISVQLVSTHDGYKVWSQTYEPEVTDAFAIQDRIARNVAQFLRHGESEAELPERSWTRSQEAAEAYYVATHHRHRRRAEALDLALRYYTRAIEHDPEFALAYAGRAKTYFFASELRYGNLPEGQARQAMIADLETAEALDAELAELYALRSGLAYEDDRFEDAEAASLRALELNPGSAEFYKDYANVISRMGRDADALTARERAVALDPLSPALRLNLATSYVTAGMLDAAEAQAGIANELDPAWHATWAALARLRNVRGHLAGVIEAGERAVATEGEGARWATLSSMLVADAWLNLGEYALATQWLDRVDESSRDEWAVANRRLHTLLAQDRFAEADVLLSQHVARAPDHPAVLGLGGLYRAIMGQDDAALAMLEHARALPAKNDDGNLLVGQMLAWGYLPAVHLARLYAGGNRPDEAEALLARAETFIASEVTATDVFPGPHYVRASIHALRGERRRALRSLHRAIALGWSELWFAERDPVFAAYRGERDYQAVLDGLRARLDTERAQAMIRHR